MVDGSTRVSTPSTPAHRERLGRCSRRAQRTAIRRSRAAARRAPGRLGVKASRVTDSTCTVRSGRRGEIGRRLHQLELQGQPERRLR